MTANSKPEHQHFVTLTLSDDSGVKADFICSAPPGSDCRKYCAQGCEYITDACRQNHQWDEGFQGLPKCNLTTWIEECGGYWWESYDGPATMPRSGPISFTWEGDFYNWQYADEKSER